MVSEIWGHSTSYLELQVSAYPCHSSLTKTQKNALRSSLALKLRTYRIGLYGSRAPTSRPSTCELSVGRTYGRRWNRTASSLEMRWPTVQRVGRAPLALSLTSLTSAAAIGHTR